MTANRRIILNIIATYGRSLYALAIGLFSGRWILMSLGEVDYGLMGVVGGMACFVSFLNGLMADAVGRFYAFSVGAAENNSPGGLEECRKWFNTALLIHTTLPIVLIVMGYPAGVWTIKHYLVIPVDRIAACVWVWRFVCISCFVGMANVPFHAMYKAKQEIAELTLYSFAATTINFIFVWYMVSHPAIWFTKFMAFSCALSVIPNLIISIRAVIKYSECRFNVKYLWSGKRVLDMLNFSGGRFICSLSQMLSSQGSTILVNKMLGPAKNAAMSIGGTVAGHCASLSSSFTGAYEPAIANAAGARDYGRMRQLMLVTCSSSSAAVLLFMLPICLEIDEVMVLWLKNPPAGAGVLCLSLLVVTLADRISDGLWMGIFALGKIFAFQTWESILWFAVLPFAYIFVKAGLGIFGVGLAMVVAKVLAIGMKLYFSKRLCGISIREWIFRVAMPLALVSMIPLAVGLAPRMMLAPSFLRVVVTTLCVEIVFLPLCWFVLLPMEVRSSIVGKFSRKLRGGEHA